MQNVLLHVKAVSSQYFPSGYRGGQLVSSEKSKQLFLIGLFSTFLRFLYDTRLRNYLLSDSITMLIGRNAMS